MAVSYEIIRSSRKTVAVEIKGDGRVFVRAPYRMPLGAIQRFVDEKAEWIRRHLAGMAQRQQSAQPVLTAQELQALAERAVQDLPQRVQRYAAHVGVNYGRITIRAQKTRWGSCSAKGNLNFNCLLMLCPEAVRDYVVVHELCHRREMNHSARFWQEVGKVMPDYAVHRRWLKENGPALIRRLGQK